MKNSTITVTQQFRFQDEKRRKQAIQEKMDAHIKKNLNDRGLSADMDFEHRNTV